MSNLSLGQLSTDFSSWSCLICCVYTLVHGCMPFSLLVSCYSDMFCGDDPFTVRSIQECCSANGGNAFVSESAPRFCQQCIGMSTGNIVCD